jgi:hypothetical protein
MRQLPFPDNEIVGILDWLGARNVVEGPILATHVVDVPDDVEVSLSIQRVQSVERDDFSGGGFITSRITQEGSLVSERTSSQGWRISSGGGSPLHLGFLLKLPSDSITDISMVGAAVLADSLSSLTHLAPGLTRLYLGDMHFEDNVLQQVARLENLIYLQTWGSRFTDAGVQQLGALEALEMLYLEEENLMPAAFDFVTSLPNLTRLVVRRSNSLVG